MVISYCPFVWSYTIRHRFILKLIILHFMTSYGLIWSDTIFYDMILYNTTTSIILHFYILSIDSFQNINTKMNEWIIILYVLHLFNRESGLRVGRSEWIWKRGLGSMIKWQHQETGESISSCWYKCWLSLYLFYLT